MEKIIIVKSSRCNGKTAYMYQALEDKVRKETIKEIIDKVDDMIGGKLIAQALREMYLEEESNE